MIYWSDKWSENMSLFTSRIWREKKGKWRENQKLHYCCKEAGKEVNIWGIR